MITKKPASAVLNQLYRKPDMTMSMTEPKTKRPCARGGPAEDLSISEILGRAVAKRRRQLPQAIGAATALAAALAPGSVHACACGCGVFDVATLSMFPRGPGGMAWLEYDYQDQNQNWSGSSRAPAANNPDKEIRTHFLDLGFQYMVNASWGFQVEVPSANRYFKTTGGASGTDIVSLDWWSLGDIRLWGIYSGFSDDMSTGITFGTKLPTGNYSFNDAFGDVDRDSEIGTGSTDILLGGYHYGDLSKNHRWGWFAQGQLDVPVLTQAQYRPGLELDGAAGTYFKGLFIGNVGITPIAQIIGSERTRDTGAAAANPVASGYQRVLLSPALQIDYHRVRLYADVEIPVYQHFTGNQLAAPALFKVVLSYMF
jgi:hypothetical protein